MRLIPWRFATVAWLVVSAFAAPASAAGIDAWLEHSSTKVAKPFSTGPGHSDLLVQAARGEYEAFQVVVRAQGDAVEDVSVEMSDLAGPAGKTFSAANAAFYLEYYVHIETPSPCESFFSLPCSQFPLYERLPGDYPDALIPFVDPYKPEHAAVAAPFLVPANDLQTVFIDLFVPPDTAAGTYAGKVSVLVAGAVVADFPVTLEVWDFVMPAGRHIGTAYGYSEGMIWGYHPSADPERAAAIARNYEMEAHRHRIDFTNYNPGIPIGFDADGKLIPIDFSAFDGALGPRIDGSYFDDGAGINRFNLGMFSPGFGTGGWTEEQFSAAAAAVAEHLDEKGWLEHVYLYSLDEPWIPANWAAGSYDKIRNDVLLLNKNTDLWKGRVLVTGPWVEPLDESVDIWCPVTPMYDSAGYFPSPWPGEETYGPLIQAGKELWFYVCNANFPPAMGYDVDTRFGYEPRLLKWGAWAEHATGFLFWFITYWQAPDPWHVLVNLPQFGPAFSRHGDGILIYPGDHNGSAGAGAGSPPDVSLDGPVVSYRLKQIRDGLEDWELFLLATDLGAEEYARCQVGTVYQKFGQLFSEDFDLDNPPWTLSEDALFAARNRIGLRVQHLTHPDLYPDLDPTGCGGTGPVDAADAAEPVEPAADVIEAVEPAGDAALADAAEVLSDTVADLPDATAEESARKSSSGGCAAGSSTSLPVGATLAGLALLVLGLTVAGRGLAGGVRS